MLHSLQTAVGRLEDILQSARQSDVSGKDVPGKMFLPAVAAYKQLYDDLAVKNTQEFDSKVSSTEDDDVRNVLSKLDALELEWNELLKTVDPEVKTNETLCVAEGDTIVTPVKLESARTGSQTNLESLLSSSDDSYLHLILLRYLS